MSMLNLGLRCGIKGSSRLGTQCFNARLYATDANPRSRSSSNLPLILAVAGCLGLASYVYLDRKPVEKLSQAATSKVESLAGSGFALDKDKWTPFLLTKVEPYNHNTKIYHFTFGEEGKNKTRGGEVAHALLIRSPEGDGEVKDDKGKPVIRPYTPISSWDEKGGLTLMIKEYQDGKLTPFISSLSPGKDSLLFKGPIPKFKYSPNTFDQGLCISGGSGITPMYQLINYSLSIPEDKTKWTLVFSNVTEQDILLRKEWEGLAQRNPDRLKVNFVLDKPPRGWKGETGFVTQKMLDKLFKKEGDNKVMAFVCGPPGQVKALAGPKDGPRQGELIGVLSDMGYKAEEVYKF